MGKFIRRRHLITKWFYKYPLIFRKRDKKVVIHLQMYWSSVIRKILLYSSCIFLKNILNYSMIKVSKIMLKLQVKDKENSSTWCDETQFNYIIFNCYTLKNRSNFHFCISKNLLPLKGIFKISAWNKDYISAIL